MRGPFWVSTPENDKTDKKRNAEIAALKPAARLGFRPTAPVTRMWEVAKNFQGTIQKPTGLASGVPGLVSISPETHHRRRLSTGEIDPTRPPLAGNLPHLRLTSFGALA